MVEESNIRISQVTLSPTEYRALKKWAWIHGKSMTTYAGQIIGARIESNYKLIDEIFEAEAKKRGLTVEELEQQIDG